MVRRMDLIRPWAFFAAHLPLLVVSQFGTHVHPERSVIVNLFEWKWKDVGKECVDYLAPNGFGAVQVSPAAENVVVTGRPWWERYQPISYELDTRSGSEEEFRAMVRQCNGVGVRVYVDVVLNHMAAGADAVVGTGGRMAHPRLLEYPVFNEEDFHPECHIDNNQSDANSLRGCRLTSFPDLNHGSEFVQLQILDFLNKLVDYGVAGFHIDSAKFMWPADLKRIFDQVKNLNTDHGFFPFSRPFIALDVFDLWNGDQVSKFEYGSFGLVSDYAFAEELSKIFSRQRPLSTLKKWPSNWDFLPPEKSLVFVDTPLMERQMYPNGNPIGNLTLTARNRKSYLMAISFLLATNYGTPRLLSSYDYLSMDQGPPMDSQESILSPSISWLGQCTGGFRCQHRWPEVQRMVQFRNAVAGGAMNNWADNGADQVAFCVGNSGFVAFNAYNLAKFDAVLQVCLPEGRYCDVISGRATGVRRCTGEEVFVNKTGFARISIPANHRVGVLAIHVGEKLQ